MTGALQAIVFDFDGVLVDGGKRIVGSAAIARQIGPCVDFGFGFYQPVLGCHRGGGLVPCMGMQATEAEKAKAEEVEKKGETVDASFTEVDKTDTQ
mgnify:CR=1 FL=1